MTPGRPDAAGDLPRSMYLLCHDPARRRMGDDTTLVRGPLLRAAAVAELRLDGLLDGSGGRARRTGAALPDDGFLGDVLSAVPPDGTASWSAVLEDGWEDAEAHVRQQLVDLGAVTVDRRRWFGVPSRVPTVSTPAGPDVLRERVRSVVLSGAPDAASSTDAVLALLAVDGDVRTVFRGPEHRRHRAAIRALGTRVDAELPGLRTALGWVIAARRTEASA